MKKFFVEIFKSCYHHDILNLAANISFFSMLSLLPLAMIFVSVLAHVLGQSVIVGQIADTLTDVIPGAQQLFMTNVHSVIAKKEAIGIWGLVSLIAMSTFLFASLERAFDVIFHIEKKRNFLQSRLLAIGVIFVILLLLFVPSALRLIESVLSGYGYHVPLHNLFSDQLFFILFAIISFVIVVTIITNHKVYIRYAFIGGLVYLAGIAVAKYAFGIYLSVAFDRYNLIYGSLTVLVLMAIWVYYLASVFLISAEIVAYLQKNFGKKKVTSGAN